MVEYIEREKAFKLIKEQKEKETGAYSRGKNKGLIIAGSIINNKEVLPTADVVEVVRCKDCRHFGKNKEYRDTKLPFSFCDKFHHNIMTDNDFCSYGEKRSEG